MPKATLLSSLTRRHPRSLTSEASRELLAQRDSWLVEIDPSHLFFPLFDLMPGVSFFAKNRQGELMLMSRHNREVYAIEDEVHVIGETDFSLNPADMAHAYVADDMKVLATGEPLLNRVELWFNDRGIPDWFVVNKLPIRDRSGAVIGVMGYSQSYEGRSSSLEPFGGLAKVVTHIRQHYEDATSIARLARTGGLSPRQLQRKFKQVFGVGPHDFVVRTRLVAACRAILETDRTLGEIALSCGFCDQSAFTRYFRLHLGVTPRRYRMTVGLPAESDSDQRRSK